MQPHIMHFTDPARAPLRFIRREYDSDVRGWYVYLDRISRPVIVKDSDIARIEYR